MNSGCQLKGYVCSPNVKGIYAVLSVSQKLVHWVKLEAFLTEHRHLSFLLRMREAASLDVQALVIEIIGKCVSIHVASPSLENPLVIHGQYGVKGSYGQL